MDDETKEINLIEAAKESAVPIQSKERSSQREIKRSHLIIIIIMVWVTIFIVMSSAKYVVQYWNYSINSLSIIFGVSVQAVVIAIVLGFYITITLLAVSSKAGRLIISSVTSLGLKREASFYPKTFGGVSSVLAANLGATVGAVASVLEKHRASGDNQGELSAAEYENFENSIMEKLGAKIQSDSVMLERDALQSICEKSLSRLSDQTVVLGSRANLTLWMGIGFCSIGMIVLWYSFFSNSSYSVSTVAEGLEWVELAKSYAPRLTLVVLIEVIGFFFLKMYRAALSEIRYVQNEITNVEMRILSLNASLKNSLETLPMVIETLVKTERNSVIEKGQTTIEIERERVGSEADKSVLHAAVSLLHGTEKASLWKRQ